METPGEPLQSFLGPYGGAIGVPKIQKMSKLPS